MALNLYVIDGDRYSDAIRARLGDDLVAYWRMDEAPGVQTCAADPAVAAVTGVGDIEWSTYYLLSADGGRHVTTDVPLALEFGAYATEGSAGESGAVPNDVQLFATEMTWSGWVRIATGTLGTQPSLFQILGTGGGTHGGGGLLLNASNALVWRCRSSVPSNFDTTIAAGSYPLDEWFHLVVTRTTASSGTVTMYINGVQAAQATGRTLSIPSTSSYIGDALSGFTPGAANAANALTHVAVFSSALTAAEVVDLYEAGSDTDRFLVNPYLDANSLRIVDSVGQRSTCDFMLQVRSDLVDPFRPLDGAEVIVVDTTATAGDDRVFAGFIDTIEEDGEPAFDSDGSEELLSLTCSCVDYTELVDRHVVIADWENVVSGAIPRDLVADYLAADGVTIPPGFVEDGPVVTRVVGSYVTAGSVLDELAGRTGMSWFIDYYRRLRWYAAGTADAPFDVVESSGVPNVHRIRRKRSRTMYRNRQYVKGGTDTTDLRTESFKGDTEAKTFVVAYPVKTAPTITVNGSAQTVGVKGVDTNRDWYWSEGSTEIVQEDADAALSAAQTIAITYRGTYPITVVAQDASEIAARAEREGTSGLYENVESANDVDRSDMALERAEGLLRRHGTVRDQGTVSTSSAIEPQAANLRAGQVMTVDVPRRGIEGDMLVEQVTISSGQGGVTWYEFDIVSEESSGSWADFFRRLALLAGAGPAVEGDILVYVRNLGDAIVVSDEFDVPVSASYAAAIVGTAIVGYSEVGA